MTTQNHPQSFRELAPFKDTISYADGLTTRRGTLEWGTDNRLRLQQIDHKTGKVLSDVFNVAPTEIKSVKGLGGMLTFTLASGKRINIIFSYFSTLGFALSPLGADATTKYRTSLPKWLAKLEANGVKVEFTYGATVLKIGLIGGLIGVIILLALVFVTVAISPDI